MMKLTKEQKQRVDDLLFRMTLEEKIGQMNQESPSIVGGFEVPFEELIEMLTDGRLSNAEFEKIMSTARQDYHETEIRAGGVGSLMVQDPVKINELQKIAVEESRLGIPLLFGLDVIHGFRTVFPIAIAEAGTFDEKLMTETARMAARESRASGISWHFAPMVDVARDPRWGRVSEGPGEDPYRIHHLLTASQRAARLKGQAAPVPATTSRRLRTSVQPQTSQWGQPGENRAGLRYHESVSQHSSDTFPSRGCVANTAKELKSDFYLS